MAHAGVPQILVGWDGTAGIVHNRLKFASCTQGVLTPWVQGTGA